MRTGERESCTRFGEFLRFCLQAQKTRFASRLNTSSCSRRSRILASREVRPSTDRSAGRIRINNASIARCSTRLAPLRHADDVLNRHKTQGNDVTAKKIFAGRSLTTRTQNFESLDLGHCAMKPPSTGIGRPVTYAA